MWLEVTLKSSAGEIQLSTVGGASGVFLLDGVRGFGLPEREIESTPLPAVHGSVFRSTRFGESEMMLPVAFRDENQSKVALRVREFERVLAPASSEPVELIVRAPELGTVRRRWCYYQDGLQGGLGGQDSHVWWRHCAVKLLALDPLWFGQTRVQEQRVSAARKAFLTASSTGTGAGVPFFPVMLSDSTVEGAYVLDIQGDAEVWPVWEVTGPGEDLLIQNDATGDRIFVEGQIGETITITTRPQEQDVVSASAMDGSLWERVSEDSTFFPLQPGINKVRMSMVSGKPESTVTLKYVEQWMAGF